jgi:streptomycin 6-kinase
LPGVRDSGGARPCRPHPGVVQDVQTVFELPSDLVRDVEMYDGTGSPRRVWMAALPERVAELSRRWSLEVGRPYQPGGCASWVAPALDDAGARVVLKIGWRHEEAEHEADGLRAWRGEGTVQLIDALPFEDTSALLLERCEPGTALSNVLPALDQDLVVAGLLRRLWIEPPLGHPFRTLSIMCDRWADEFEHRYAASDPRLRLDPGVARAGIELFRGLPRTADRTVVLYTDLHPENVLAARREPWLAIDPNPYVGDPTYDALQHMLNHPDRLATDPAGFLRRMAELLDLDPSRLRDWLFARSVQESIDAPNLREVAIALRP